MVFRVHDSRPRQLTSWGTAAANILHSAGIDQTQIADATGLTKQHLGNCFKGWRKPSVRKIAHINRAIARFTGCPNVGPYLDCEAMLCGLLDPWQRIPIEILQYARFALDEADGVLFRPAEAKTPVLSADHSMPLDGLIAGVLTMLDSYAHLFRSGYRDEISAFMRSAGETASRKFAVKVHRTFQRILIAELLPPPSAPLGFDAVCDVLERHGIAVDVTELGTFARASEYVQWVIRRELISAKPSAPSKERIAAEQRILAALNERFDLQLKPHDAKPHTKGNRS
jgi:hypothetical protein